jgi:hypothetical protein
MAVTFGLDIPLGLLRPENERMKRGDTPLAPRQGAAPLHAAFASGNAVYEASDPFHPPVSACLGVQASVVFHIRTDTAG